jgi:3-isopropylmalate dehydrogenase
LKAGSTCSASRELTGGLYFGQPKGQHEQDGEPVAIDTMVYRRAKSNGSRMWHSRLHKAAAKLVTSIDKANVLENGVLWRKTVTELAKQYPM